MLTLRRLLFPFSLIIIINLGLSYNLYGSRTEGFIESVEQENKRDCNLKRKRDEFKDDSFKDSQSCVPKIKRSKIKRDLEYYLQNLTVYLEPLKETESSLHQQLKLKISTLSKEENYNAYKNLANLYNDAAENHYFKTESAYIYKDEAQLRQLMASYFKKDVTADDYVNIGHACHDAIEAGATLDPNPFKSDIIAQLYDQAAGAYANSVVCLQENFNQENNLENIEKKLIKGFHRAIESYRLAGQSFKMDFDYGKAVFCHFKAVELYKQQLSTLNQSLGEDENETFGNLYRKLFSAAIKAKDERALEWGELAANFYEAWINMSVEKAVSYQYDLSARHCLTLADNFNTSFYYQKAALYYEQSLIRSGTRPATYNDKTWGDVACTYIQAAEHQFDRCEQYKLYIKAIEFYEKFLLENPQNDIPLFQNIRSAYCHIINNCMSVNKEVDNDTEKVMVKIRILSRLAQLQAHFYISPYANTQERPADYLRGEYERTISLYHRAAQEAFILGDDSSTKAFLEESNVISNLIYQHFDLKKL